jgi:hypothetical protein
MRVAFTLLSSARVRRDQQGTAHQARGDVSARELSESNTSRRVRLNLRPQSPRRKVSMQPQDREGEALRCVSDEPRSEGPHGEGTVPLLASHTPISNFRSSRLQAIAPGTPFSREGRPKRSHAVRPPESALRRMGIVRTPARRDNGRTLRDSRYARSHNSSDREAFERGPMEGEGGLLTAAL